MKKLIKRLLDRKADIVSDTVKPYIKGKVLDIGGGRGLIAKKLQQKTNCDIMILEFYNSCWRNKTDIPCVEYNMEYVHPKKRLVLTIPFKKNYFGTSLLLYVLHHCVDPRDTLKEAVRVSKRIIIIEDMPVFPITHIFDCVSNNIINDCGSFYNFKKDEQWKKEFKKLGLKLIYEQDNVERVWYYPVRHKMYVLEKGDKINGTKI